MVPDTNLRPLGEALVEPGSHAEPIQAIQDRLPPPIESGKGLVALGPDPGRKTGHNFLSGLVLLAARGLDHGTIQKVLRGISLPLRGEHHENLEQEHPAGHPPESIPVLLRELENRRRSLPRMRGPGSPTPDTLMAWMRKSPTPSRTGSWRWKTALRSSYPHGSPSWNTSRLTERRSSPSSRMDHLRNGG